MNWGVQVSEHEAPVPNVASETTAGDAVIRTPKKLSVVTPSQMNIGRKRAG